MVISTMFKSMLLAGLIFLSANLRAQRVTAEPLLFLPDEVGESSGLIFLNDRLITHNDSGGKAILYEVDPESGKLIRELTVENAKNVDWEDIAFDQQFIYIGDIGNNNGQRTDLSVYRVSLLDYFQSSNDSVSVDTIRFSYQDQVTFDMDPRTNYDAGAIISFQDSLYIFTKNRGDLHTNIYSLPKTPGDYIIHQVGRINTRGLVTGAVYNTMAQEIMLAGYDFAKPFIFRISNFDGNQFAGGQLDRFSFEMQGSFQIEGIEAITETEYFISSETNNLGEASLWHVSTDFLVSTEDPIRNNMKVYPIPATTTINLSGISLQEIHSARLIDNLGKEVISLDSFSQITTSVQIDIAGVPEGLYHLCVNTDDNSINYKILVKR
jgi:hypothetical protein